MERFKKHLLDFTFLVIFCQNGQIEFQEEKKDLQVGHFAALCPSVDIGEHVTIRQAAAESTFVFRGLGNWERPPIHLRHQEVREAHPHPFVGWVVGLHRVVGLGSQ